MKFEFDHKTGTMQPKKNEEIYFAKSMGGGLIVDDKKHNIKFIIERDERITKLFGNFDKDKLNLYDMRDARMIADRVRRLFGGDHKYTDFHYFLKGYVMNESVIKSCSDFLGESAWGDMMRRSSGEIVRKEDELTDEEMETLKQYISHYAYEIVYGEGRGTEACKLDEFCDFLERDMESDSKIIDYVKTFWFDEICDLVDDAIEDRQNDPQEEYVNESAWGDMMRRSSGEIVRKEDDVTYDMLTDEDCTVDVLYNYVIKHYELLGDENIELNSGEYTGNVWYEIHIPITLSGGHIETEVWADNVDKIWSIDFTRDLTEYVDKMNTVVETDDENINSDKYSRAYTNTDPVLCSEVVDFLDEILGMVPNPALKRIKKK